LLFLPFGDEEQFSLNDLLHLYITPLVSRISSSEHSLSLHLLKDRGLTVKAEESPPKVQKELIFNPALTFLQILESLEVLLEKGMLAGHMDYQTAENLEDLYC
jgi:hypothetical protein